MSRTPLALILALALAAAAATPAQRPPPRLQRQLPPGAHAKTLANAKPSVIRSGGRSRGGRGGGGGGGSDFMQLLSVATGPQLQLLGPQYLAFIQILDRLAGLGGAEAVLSLFTASAGASSGGQDNPAFVGTADSSEEVQDLIA